MRGRVEGTEIVQGRAERKRSPGFFRRGRRIRACACAPTRLGGWFPATRASRGDIVERDNYPDRRLRVGHRTSRRALIKGVAAAGVGAWAGGLGTARAEEIGAGAKAAL